ncbi:MAG: hypothetical protein Q9190_007254 [Brigantiaea leucoxantha]
MAWNVYLAFFYKYTAQQLRSLDKWYLLGCYGASFVPALTFLFVDTSRRGKIYGPAIRREQLHGFLNPLNENPFAGWTTITTEVDITVEPSRSPSEGGGGAAISPDRALALPGPVQNGWGFDPYTVNVEVGEPPQDDQRRPSRGREILNMRSLTREAAKRESVDPGAWLYARVAFLFFVGMLIIWVRMIAICVSPPPPPLRIPQEFND